jgi:hypothetical protein
MTVADVLRTSRKLLAAGAAASLAEALRAATDDVSARIEAWKLVRDASLPWDTPLEAVEAALMAIERPGSDENRCAYCGTPEGWHTVPGAIGGIPVCTDCLPQAVADSGIILRLRLTRA